MRKAVINRGVSVVVLPGDVALKAAPENASTHWYAAADGHAAGRGDQKLAQVLRYSSNIALLCGAPARTPSWSICREIKAPVVHACVAKSTLSMTTL